MKKLADISMFESLGSCSGSNVSVFNKDGYWRGLLGTTLGSALIGGALSAGVSASGAHAFGGDVLGSAALGGGVGAGFNGLVSGLNYIGAMRGLKKAKNMMAGRALRKAVESGDVNNLNDYFGIGDDGYLDDGEGLTLRAKDGTAFYVFKKDGELMAMDVSRHPEWSGVITVGEFISDEDEDEDEDITDDVFKDAFNDELIDAFDMQPRKLYKVGS